MTTKYAALALIQALPDDVTLEAIQAELEDRLGEEPALTPEEWKAAWLPEWERRLEDMRSGKDPGIPGEDFMQQLRETTAEVDPVSLTSNGRVTGEIDFARIETNNICGPRNLHIGVHLHHLLAPENAEPGTGRDPANTETRLASPK